MMKLTQAAAIFAGCGLASAATGSFTSRRDTSLFRRWDYDVCLNDCTLRDVPIPDKDNFQLPLENNWSEQCPPTFIGDWDAPTAVSKVCLEFSGAFVVFNFAAFPGYVTKTAKVTWKLMGNMLDSSNWSSPPPTATVDCEPAPIGDGFVCKVPFAEILQKPTSTSIKDLLTGMCPNGDREGLGLYLAFSGTVLAPGSAVEIPFKQQYPCKAGARDTNRQCTEWNTDYDYFSISYRCTKCNVAACPPPTTSCGFGTAFGYQSLEKSVTLNTQSGKGCNRWGWYQTPTLTDLTTGIGGPLYVGAGQNVIDKAITVGTWTAKLDAAGKVSVTYATTAGSSYRISQVHVDLDCLAIDKCAPGSYTFGKDDLADVTTMSFTTPPLTYPACSGGSKAYLTVHAAVNALTNSATCEPPKAA